MFPSGEVPAVYSSLHSVCNLSNLNVELPFHQIGSPTRLEAIAAKFRFGSSGSFRKSSNESAPDSVEQSDDNDEVEIRRNQALAGKRRGTVSAEVYQAEAVSEVWVPPKTPKNREEEIWLEQLLSKHMLFRHLDDRELQTVVGALEPCSVSTGETLFTEGA